MHDVVRHDVLGVKLAQLKLPFYSAVDHFLSE